MYRNNFRSNNNRGRKRPFGPDNHQRQGGQKRPVTSFDPRRIVNSSEGVAIEEAYKPQNLFSDFNIHELLKQNIASKNYSEPTPIQDQAINHILEGRDLIGIANTGTGKTAAFLIPLIHKVLKEQRAKVIIVTPTRELAVQINEELNEFTRGMRINSALLIGGVSTYHQRRALRDPYNFAIGTPGRLKDLIRERALDLSLFTTVVLDEADRMVDIGFIREIKYFISLLPKNRQSLFFSATIDGKVQEMLKEFVDNPVTISVKKTDTVQNVHQEIIKTESQNRKVDQLHDLLVKESFDKVIVFGRTKWGIQKLANELVKRGFKAGAIHGNKSQNQRQRTLQQFKASQIDILLATDVASRGLDIDNVSHVINFDLPASYEDYIHRIGRTGRANKRGVALTFV